MAIRVRCVKTMTLRWNPVTRDVLGRPLVGTVFYSVWRKSGTLVASGLTTPFYKQRASFGRSCYYVTAACHSAQSAASNVACATVFL
jgi:hypothetical protein